ncbi:beta,beta-carotene 15,15'-dioxygenase-like isoform X2 [Lethenteron reissneri]|uniref:beta,beta-carotene 15,15'-dioxygenase-like isoform X1 n=1 Tax=Lethenteron reissneri TaxID=7753 RepID=UPI002AB729DA|nr:beta,beta-carotene 15,15'-dioxygenase-like isoform X1 [Lethenteron reissneri]XP_061421766.1 beta,beta-carotene 15,15'-dioxygenase-like isoform X2 [Lethenteron reissneri]
MMMMPLRRQDEEECTEPVKLMISGGLPEWLRGCLIRNGPGKHSVGDTHYCHWFDGLALLRKFDFRDGEVWFSSRYLRSDTYTKNVEANRILVPEFGTRVPLAEGMGLFQRSLALLRSALPEVTDNCSVNLMRCGTDVYAQSQTPLLRRIEPTSLLTSDKVNLAEKVGMNMLTAHPLYEPDGTAYNVATVIGEKGRTKYNLLQIPPTAAGEEHNSGVGRARVLCSVPCSRMISPSYLHSFGLSHSHALLLESPHVLHVLRMLTSSLRGDNMASCLSYDPGQKTHIHVLARKREDAAPPSAPSSSSSSSPPDVVTCYTDAGVFIHHANTYNDEGHLVADVTSHDGDGVYAAFYIGKGEEEEGRDNKKKRVKSMSNSSIGGGGGDDDVKEGRAPAKGRLLRFVIPLEANEKGVEIGTNLVTLPGSEACAIRDKDGHLYCIPEEIAQSVDLPCINPAFSGVKNRFLYVVETQAGMVATKILKLDLLEKTRREWREPRGWVGEPVFIARPGATDEDDGLLLVVVGPLHCGEQALLVVLGARDLEELARAPFPSALPLDMHGIFLPA